MNRTDMIKAIVATMAEDEKKVTQKLVREVLDAQEVVVCDAVNRNEDVQVLPGVVLHRQYKEAHEGRNPQTGETIMIDGKYAPHCKFGKGFRAAVNE